MALTMSLTADDRLVLIRIKIERAKKHLSELEAELIASRTERLNVVGTQRDAQTGKSSQYHFDLPILPFNAVATAGDVIHNLRSALDHLAYQLVLTGSGKEPSRRVEFPIAKDAAAYESGKANKVEGMRDLAIKFIDMLKPYRGGNEPLWRLHELDNIDKHRTLFAVAPDYLFTAHWQPVNTWPYWLKTNSPHFAGVFDPEVEKEVQLEIGKAISDQQILKGDALLPSLHQLVKFVEELVFSFRPLLE